MPTDRVADDLVAGAAGFDFPRRNRDSAKQKLLSLRRQSGGPSGRRQRESGLARPPDRSLTPKSQANLVWSVRPVSFTKRSTVKAGRAHSYIGVLGDMRSIAPIMLLPW